MSTSVKYVLKVDLLLITSLSITVDCSYAMTRLVSCKGYLYFEHLIDRGLFAGLA